MSGFKSDFLKAVDLNNDGKVLYGKSDLKQTELYQYFYNAIKDFTNGQESLRKDKLQQFAKKYHAEYFLKGFSATETITAMQLTEDVGDQLGVMDSLYLDRKERDWMLSDEKKKLENNEYFIMEPYFVDGEISVEDENKLIEIAGDFKFPSLEERLYLQYQGIFKLCEDTGYTNNSTCITTKEDYKYIKAKLKK